MALGLLGKSPRIVAVSYGAPSGILPVSVVILDGHREARLALAAAFGRDADFALLGGTEDTAEALQLCARFQPQIVLVDSRTVYKALETCRTVLERSPRSQIVLLSTFFDPGEQRRYEDAGASACYLKSEPFRVLATRLKSLVGLLE